MKMAISILLTALLPTRHSSFIYWKRHSSEAYDGSLEYNESTPEPPIQIQPGINVRYAGKNIVSVGPMGRIRFAFLSCTRRRPRDLRICARIGTQMLNAPQPAQMIAVRLAFG